MKTKNRLSFVVVFDTFENYFKSPIRQFGEKFKLPTPIRNHVLHVKSKFFSGPNEN